jgi:hypothetical protein
VKVPSDQVPRRQLVESAPAGRAAGDAQIRCVIQSLLV